MGDDGDLEEENCLSDDVVGTGQINIILDSGAGAPIFQLHGFGLETQLKDDVMHIDFKMLRETEFLRWESVTSQWGSRPSMVIGSTSRRG